MSIVPRRPGWGKPDRRFTADGARQVEVVDEPGGIHDGNILIEFRVRDAHEGILPIVLARNTLPDLIARLTEAQATIGKVLVHPPQLADLLSRRRRR